MAAPLGRFPGVALITGAGGTGIGAAVARSFARSGCTRIAMTDVDKTTLALTGDAVRSINRDVQVHAADGDVSDEAFVRDFVGSAASTFGRIDYSVQCAGILSPGLRSHDTSAELFDRVNGVNYRGTWLVTREVISRMMGQEPLAEHPRQRGSVVNIASQLGIVGRPGAAAYCASKAAIINMTRCDAIDYSGDGIRVNCVCPGVIATPMTTGSREVEERLRPAVDIAPMRRMGEPQEVADSVLFLSSAQASFIQGHALVVDGGYTIN